MKNLRLQIANLESSIKYMANNNSEGQFDTALFKHRECLPRLKQSFKHFLRIPAGEERAAEAA